MLPLRWRPEAEAQLRSITASVAGRNPDAATRLTGLITGAAEDLPKHPYLYRPGRVPNTREAVVHPNHIVIDRVELACVRILAVIHARQRDP